MFVLFRRLGVNRKVAPFLVKIKFGSVKSFTIFVGNKKKNKMNNFTAVGLAEGFVEAESEEQVIEAWQHLLDTRLCFQLQGWFGRVARDYVKNGIIIDHRNEFGLKESKE